MVVFGHVSTFALPTLVKDVRVAHHIDLLEQFPHPMPVKSSLCCDGIHGAAERSSRSPKLREVRLRSLAHTPLSGQYRTARCPLPIACPFELRVETHKQQRTRRTALCS